MRISDWSSDVCSSDLLCAVGPEGYEPTLEAIAEQAVVDDEAAIVRGLSIRGTLEPSRCDNFIAVKQGPGTMAFVAISTYRTFRLSVRPTQVNITLGGCGMMNDEIGRESGGERVGTEV